MAKKRTAVKALPSFQIEYVAIDSLRGASYNPRQMPDAAMSALMRSVEEFGLVDPIIINQMTGNIVGGHQRWEAAKRLKVKEVPTVWISLDEKREMALNLALNKISGEWDLPKLKDVLEELDDGEFDLDLTGFGQEEIEALLTAAPPGGIEGLTDPDDVPEVNESEPPVTQPGDLWILGEHRLLCGDSTKADDVVRVMNGSKASLMNTDPPYGVSYENDSRPNPGVAKPRVAKPRVANDALNDANLQDFLEKCFKAASSVALNDNAAWYMWHAHLTQGFFAAAAAAAAEVILHRQIIWVKPVLLLTRGQYHWKHEPCFMGWRKGFQPPDYGAGNGERNQTTVWEVGSVTQAERKEFNHATPKPTGLFEIPIVKHLNHGEICFEPFAGSGPQFIAAEQLGRKCFGLEISPQYCDVIVKRWQNFTGKKAIHAETGQPFGE